MWKLTKILILLLTVSESFQGFAGNRDNTENENSTDNSETVTEYDDDDKTGDMGQFSQDPYPETTPTLPDVVSSSTNFYRETQPPPPDCLPLPKEERSVEAGLGWAAATAILIFAFSNTVIVGATLMISYVLYQIVIAALAVMAPGVAVLFVKFMDLFTFL